MAAPPNPDRSHPIEGQVVLLAGAKASVPLWRLSALLEDVQRHLADRREEYDRRFERVDVPVEDDADANDDVDADADADTADDADGESRRVYYLAGDDHWERVGERLGLDDREVDAVRRTHREQLRRDGRRLDREEEFETAVEIRDPVAVAPP